MFLEFFSQLLDITFLLPLLVGLVTYGVMRHLLGVRTYPPGPFPLPVLGNLLEFRGEKVTPPAMMQKWRQKYGDVYTVWMGARPTVVVSKWEDVYEALVNKKNSFSGRVYRRSVEIFTGDADGLMFSDFGPCWATLRKIMLSAVRQYSSSEKLAVLVSDVVDEVVDHMVQENKAIDLNNCTYLTVYNILASSSFGKRYKHDDPEFLKLRQNNKDAVEAIGDGFPGDVLPFLRFFFRKQEKIVLDITEEFRKFTSQVLEDHKKSYVKGVVRDFTDALLSAREEAEEEGKDSREHMSDKNLGALIGELFTAGSDTTRVTLNWLILTICEYPDIQTKMQEEISTNIGLRIPMQGDRDSCPYTYAVIMETLRMRMFTDFTIERKSICDSEIGGYKIPKDTSIFFNIRSNHFEESFFADPHTFTPERFLDSEGRVVTSRMTGFMAFSLGRRSCPGERLAKADLFLVVARLLQTCSLRLEKGPGSVSFQPNVLAFANMTQPFNVLATRRQ